MVGPYVNIYVSRASVLPTYTSVDMDFLFLLPFQCLGCHWDWLSLSDCLLDNLAKSGIMELILSAMTIYLFNLC